MEAQEILTLLGADPETITTIEALKEWKEQKYIAKELAPQNEEIRTAIVGQRMGAIETKMKPIITALGIDGKELEGKKVEEKLDYLAKALPERLKGQDNDERLTTLTTEYNSTKSLLESQTQALAKEKEARQKAEAKADEHIKSFHISEKINKAKSAISWAETANEFTRKGFDHDYSEKFEPVLSEDGQTLYVKDKKADKLLANETGSGHETFDNHFAKLAKDAKLVRANNGTGSAPTTAQRTTAPTTQPLNDDVRRRTYNPALYNKR